MTPPYKWTLAITGAAALLLQPCLAQNQADQAAPVADAGVLPGAAAESQAEPAAGAAPETGEPVPEVLATAPVGTPVAPATEVAEESAGSGNRLIEEITVTAQKREENLQDVPISVSAFSADVLDAKGITNAVDLQTSTPGLSYTVLQSFSIIYLRGVGTDAFLPSADLSVATYVDGIYFPFSAGLAQEFGAVERVEVLKGPQGTLFGRNSTGGAISTTTKKPGPDFETSIATGYGNESDLRTRVYTSIPLTDTFAFSVAALYNRKDSYYDHLDRSLIPDVDKAARLKLRWTPDEAFDITLTGQLSRTVASTGSQATQIDPKPSFDALFARYPLKDWHTDIDVPAELDFHNKVGYLDAKWMPGGFDLRLLASAQSISSTAYNDFDATSLPFVSFDTKGLFADIQTGELQLISNDESWGADWLKFIGGLYWIHSKAGFDPATLFAGFFSATAIPGVDPQLGMALDNLLTLAGPLLPTPVAPISVEARGLLRTISGAAFFQGTAELTDWMSLTLGGRYQVEKRDLYEASVTLGGQPDPTLPYPRQMTDGSNFSPKVSLEFRPADDLMLYGSWSKGYKSGTYNIVAITRPPNYVEPEVVTSEEIGIKSEWLDGALRLNGALFNNDIKNLQVQIISLFSSGATAFETAKGANTRGAEFDAVWQPLPASVPGLVVTAGGTYLDTEYTNFKQGSGYDEDSGLFFGQLSFLGPGRDFEGNRITQSPKFTGNLGLSYSFDVGSGTFELAGDVYTNSGLFYTAQNSPHAEQQSYYLINARVSYLYQPWGLRLTLFGRNLNDARYYLFNYETDFGTSALLQAPATYGLRLNWDFEG